MEKIQASILSMVIVYDTENERILLLNRPKENGFPGYIGPGGKIELGESFAEGAVRELHEETGLEVAPEDLSYKGVDEFTVEVENSRYMVFNYLTTTFSGTLRTNPPEGELRWVTLDEAFELPMQPWFKRRLPLFFEEGTFEISMHMNDSESKPYKEIVHKIG